MSTFLLFIRMLVALSVVLGLVALFARVAGRRRGLAPPTRRRPAAGGLPGRMPRRGAGPARAGLLAALGLGSAAPEQMPLEVVGRRALSRTSSLVVVRAGERLLLLGVTAQALSLLADLAGGDQRAEAGRASAARLDDGFDAGLGDLDSGAYGLDHSYDHGELDAGYDTSTTRPDCTPWTAMQDAPGTATAWDAFMAQLRERTVRR